MKKILLILVLGIFLIGCTQTSTQTSGTSSESQSNLPLEEILWIEEQGRMAYTFVNGMFLLQIQENQVTGTYTLNGNTLILNDGQADYEYEITINENQMTMLDIASQTPIYFTGFTEEEVQQMQNS
jgi:hypothetical protein